MANIATTLSAALQRANESVVDVIAIEGLLVLRKVLNNAGFLKSEYLKDYDILAHVSNELITFEILLDVEAVVPDDEAARIAMQQKTEEIERQAQKTYMVSKRTQRVNRMTDRRRPARDARRSAQDARKNSSDRLLEHEIALRAPRSARVTRTGKLAVALQRSTRQTKEEIEFPKDKFQGIIDSFLQELKKLILEKFAPRLEEIIMNYAF